MACPAPNMLYFIIISIVLCDFFSFAINVSATVSVSVTDYYCNMFIFLNANKSDSTGHCVAECTNKSHVSSCPKL